MDEIDGLELASVAAWPPRTSEHVAGWLLRATPGVTRRRSTAALPPRAADPTDLPAVLGRAAEFARRHGQPLAVQVSPYDEQGALDHQLTGPSRQWTGPAAGPNTIVKIVVALIRLGHAQPQARRHTTIFTTVRTGRPALALAGP